MNKPRVFTQEDIDALPDLWQWVLRIPSFLRMDEVGIDYQVAVHRIDELIEYGMNYADALTQVILEQYYAQT